MFESFLTSFKLKNTYRVNSIIFSIKQLPIIKKILPSTLYKRKGLKVFGNIISALIEMGSIFLGKLIYILLMILSVMELYKTNGSDTFIHIFVFLTISGAFLNTYMFNPTKDKYYAMVIMNMDAKKYTLSNYYYELLKLLIGFIPITIMLGSFAGVPIWICELLPIFVAMVKLIMSNYILYKFTKTKKAMNENLPNKVVWTAVGILLVIAYGLPYIGVTINENIFMIIFLISLIAGIYSLIKINSFKEYKKMYKQILTNDNVYITAKSNQTAIIKDAVSKQITYDSNSKSNKEGFAYFHELFVKRHRKILTETAKKQTLVAIAVLAIAIIAVTLNEKASQGINSIVLTYLPYFVFVMYMLNRGTAYTQAMFMNCDHSMLTYRIYRTPRVILGVFKERLKTLILINSMPAIVIAIGLPVLLFITGGTDNILNYVVLFVSIISMSIFFSVHYLVMYYLLQPYNVNTEMKSSTYRVVQMITYFVCYYMIEFKIPTLYFGIATSAFCIVYSLVSLYIAYRHAPKTFKLRI